MQGRGDPAHPVRPIAERGEPDAVERIVRHPRDAGVARGEGAGGAASAHAIDIATHQLQCEPGSPVALRGPAPIVLKPGLEQSLEETAQGYDAVSEISQPSSE